MTSTATRPTTRTRLDSLTGVRAIAAAVVLLHHLAPVWSGRPALAPLNAVARQGAAGVCLFFVLSGFVLTWSHRPGQSVSDFYRRRVARIVPAYWVALVLVTPVLLLENRRGGQNSWAGDLFSATLLQSWIPNWRWYQAGNSVGWSLSTELFFYACFPFIIPLIVRASLRHRQLMMLASTAVAIAIPLAAHPDAWHVSHQSGVAYWLVYTCPVTRLPEFICGALAGSLLAAGVRLRLPVAWAGVIALVGYLAAGQVPAYLGFVAVPIVPVLLLVFCAAEADLTARPSFLRAPVLVLLGVWSYAFYLMHQMVIRSAFLLIHSYGITFPLRGVVALAAVGTAVVCAYLLYTFVEHPAERLLMRRSRPTVERTATQLS